MMQPSATEALEVSQSVRAGLGATFTKSDLLPMMPQLDRTIAADLRIGFGGRVEVAVGAGYRRTEASALWLQTWRYRGYTSRFVSLGVELMRPISPEWRLFAGLHAIGSLASTLYAIEYAFFPSATITVGAEVAMGAAAALVAGAAVTWNARADLSDGALMPSFGTEFGLGVRFDWVAFGRSVSEAWTAEFGAGDDPLPDSPDRRGGIE